MLAYFESRNDLGVIHMAIQTISNFDIAFVIERKTNFATELRQIFGVGIAACFFFIYISIIITSHITSYTT